MNRYVNVFAIVLFGLTGILFSGCAGQHELLSGLSEYDANQVIVVLQSQDIVASKEAVKGRKVSFSIKVSDADAQRALKILVDNKLPKAQSAGIAQVYPLGSGGLIPSATQEKAQLMMALQGEIENMLLVLPGVVQARVVVVLPDTSIIRDAETPPPQATASVAVVYNPVDKKGNASVTSDDIRFLIASAIPDLSPQAVTVVMASNYPMKLINSDDSRPTAITRTLSNQDNPTITGPLQTTKATPALALAAPPAENADEETEKQEFLLFLFGGLGIAGLLVGVLGLARAVMLRGKMMRLQEKLSQASTPIPSE